MIIGGLQAAFTKIGLAHPHEHYPYEPYRNPEPTRSIRRSTSQLFTRPRKVSVLESACLTVHKIPAIVAVSGSPDTPTPRARLYSGPSRPGAPRDHHPPTPGWHRLLSPIDASTNRAFPSQNDVPSGTRTDRSHTVPAPINAVPPSFDFRELDQVKQPQSAPSQTTTFNLPDIQVTSAERRPTEANYQQAPPPPPSFDFIDMDRDSSAPLVRSSSPSLSSMHRPPSPTMGQSYRSVSPSVGHTPYYPVSQRRDSSLRTSYVAPQRSITPVPRTDSVSPATQAAIPESYDFIMSDRLSPTTHENPNYGAHYCTSPMPIYTYGSTHGTSRGNAYDSGRGDVYDATQESTNASTRDVYDATRGVVHGSAQSRGGATDMTHGQPTGLTAIIGEMEDYNRDSVPRSVPASFPSPTTTVSVDGTLDSPYLDRDPTSSNSF